MTAAQPGPTFNTGGWAKKPEHWGDFTTEDGTVVHTLRKGQRVRFYDDEGNQHGPEQPNVYPAFMWVYACTEWYRPNDIWGTILCRREVRANVYRPGRESGSCSTDKGE
ncbi:MAG: hypothetical protein ABR532_05860 [Candidatus Dormibacteria bacterium]